MTSTIPAAATSLNLPATAEALAGGNHNPSYGPAEERQWDSVEAYFECITTCSLDDGECVTHCVEELREHN
ncbi:hypothetical protein KQ313_08650 [Synechococcus sp. CS-1325]|uniref:hypothetical protein n=1 Tax=unclassified Synechococcus TaxID=2626047 RepID=UPI000DB06B36|nr:MULTISPECIES: hypothetical protein [unclassified Synechococcus]PZV01068.1 MAG: hypothetical protein DCF24_05170 [Cyanobium sp.]MCT0199744.1 hypothetical protein [Synechococcus sp. CS-1325]MCT0214236.1 hypothetical protein [Synechococcus sp. CS-1326]MCT0231295.1 hypothetical protein [Synechococcus sp. CS-1324]MCT0232566.1 hypothetical protein [Synechococcus sp. CS-1327]